MKHLRLCYCSSLTHFPSHAIIMFSINARYLIHQPYLSI
ncbi:MAG: hypothetical protein IKG86_07650 [Paludibacteraceae bacterium]|nr:hypothetical protein [Paludibacteraceae bacterium]